ncbi:MAG: riboflavin biosynthesis protein RibF [Clostridiaceae bacterium]|nr:riboflavin biosynthesis protein RibF [Clostridiaceae bacterium]
MDWIKERYCPIEESCIVAGNLDGLHLGQMAMIDRLEEIAGQHDLASALISIDRDNAKNGPKCLTSELEKFSLLEDKKIHALISLDVEEEYLEAALFNKLNQLGVKVVIIEKDDDLLGFFEKHANEFDYEILQCDPLTIDGKIVSSERVADAVIAHDYELIERLLGRPYSIGGRVILGKQKGRTVGMPTANVDYAANKLLPPEGVYGVISMIDGVPYKGMTNIGRRPSVDDFDYITVENFILDFSQNVYGKVLMMDLHAHIRDVIKFNNLEEVQEQVKKDIQSVQDKLERKFVQYTGKKK